MQIHSVPAADLGRLFEALRPEGVWLSHVSGISNSEEAEVVLKRIARWKV